jgi:hypothetical protein
LNYQGGHQVSGLYLGVADQYLLNIAVGLYSWSELVSTLREASANLPVAHSLMPET